MMDYVKEIEKIIRNKIKLTDIKSTNNEDSSQKRFYAVFGKNISYSLSPIMHNAIFNEMNMNCEYSIIDNELEECTSWIKEKGSGANVTIPYKTEVMKFLDEISEDAKEIGAVNTIKKTDDGKLVGYNPDYLAIKELISNNPLFDSTILKVLINKVGVYPISSWVELNSNEIGKVMINNNDFPLRPAVHILFDGAGQKLKDPHVINLAKQFNLFIKKSLTDDELVAKIKEPIEI